MVEELGTILRNGFEIWKKNLIICLPFVFSMLLTVIVAVLIIGSALLVTFGPLLPSMMPHITESGEIPPALVQQLQPLFLQHIGLWTGAVFVTVILVLLITAFFNAGAIGMAKEATETGRTSLSSMIDYGRQKFVQLLGAKIIVGVVLLAGFVFLIPGLVALVPTLKTVPIPQDTTNIMAFTLLGIGFLIMIIYMLIVSIVLALPPYAVVIDDLGAVDGVKKGVNCFMAHKVDVFLLWLVIAVITMGISIVLGNIPYIGGFVNLAVSLLVIQPLIVIWWSRLYLSTILIVPKQELIRESDDALKWRAGL